ncbi:MAG: ABC transporter ATP-binding protein [Coriobacteriales bacterium]|jgi:ABC-2 type transport system ATP-binding protein|nr:ABC transporter ATP-binding protein [Coriobacteriales bacterium]
MLELSKISVSYAGVHVLHDINLCVMQGEIVGVVGPNGAGKTTLFKVVSRVIEGYEGVATYNNIRLCSLASKDISYLAETPFLFDFFTPAQMLLFERTLRFPDIPESDIYNILQRLDLDAHLHKRIKALSQGLRKRVAIASAFLGNPKIIVLDEPLNSIDIQTVIILRQLIQEALVREAIVLISSHVLNFFDGLVNRIVFLKEGNMYFAAENDQRNAEELYEELFLRS